MKLTLSLVAALLIAATVAQGQDNGPNWVRVAEAAGWQPHDSQGELGYRDQLWIFGGWFQSFEAPPRDVWSSPNGKSWTQVAKEAAWLHRSRCSPMSSRILYSSTRMSLKNSISLKSPERIAP